AFSAAYYSCAGEYYKIFGEILQPVIVVADNLRPDLARYAVERFDPNGLKYRHRIVLVIHLVDCDPGARSQILNGSETDAAPAYVFDYGEFVETLAVRIRSLNHYREGAFQPCLNRPTAAHNFIYIGLKSFILYHISASHISTPFGFYNLKLFS